MTDDRGALNFDSIRMRNGTTYQFAGVIENVRTANGETISVDNEGTVEENRQAEKTVQRGAIGAAVGAIIGAITGGGKGAAIGAVARTRTTARKPGPTSPEPSARARRKPRRTA